MEEDKQDSLFKADTVQPSEEKSEIKKTEDKAGLLDFSYSRMDMFRQCPLKYKFRYVDKIKEKPKGFFFFGSAIHAALEFLYKGDSPVFPTAEQVCQAFLEFWFSKTLAQQGFRNAEEAARKRGEGLAMLREYYRVNEGKFTRAFLTEKVFKIEIDGLLVTAISDRMDYVGDGKLLITDYKTGKDVRRTPSQLYMYQKIAEANPELPHLLAEKLGKKEDRLQISQMLYYHVPTNKKYYFDRASDDEIKKFWDGALSTAEEMKSGKFEPNPAEYSCRWCDYKPLCPIYGGTGEAPRDNASNADQQTSYKNAKTSSGTQNTSSDNNNTYYGTENSSSVFDNASLMQMLNRYGDLEERKAVIEREQEMLRKRISEMPLTSGEYKTARYSANIGSKSTWKADDRDAVIELLNEFNLYTQACTLTMSGILSLLNNDSLPLAFRERLKNLLRKETSAKIDIKKNAAGL